MAAICEIMDLFVDQKNVLTYREIIASENTFI